MKSPFSHPFILLAVTALFSSTVVAQKKMDEPKKIALKYLKALAGTGDDSAREFLLGDLTLTGEGFTIPNWKIKSRDAARVEEKSVKAAVGAMRALDDAGAKALTDIMNLAEGQSDEAMTQVSQEQANKMMLPTKKLSAKFQKNYPLFSYCARAGKEVYWHPDNPWRHVMDKLGDSGKYKLELHRFNIFEKAGKKERVWPLRVLRIRAAGYDSGWKILPASDWDPDF